MQWKPIIKNKMNTIELNNAKIFELNEILDISLQITPCRIRIDTAVCCGDISAELKYQGSMEQDHN